jgi:hypothetical protein
VAQREDNVFRGLKTFKITDVTASNIARVTNPIFLQADNRSILEDVKLVNDVTLRDGGAIPGSGVAKNVQLTDNSRTDMFTPANGEVWRLSAISATANQAPSSGYVFSMFYSVKDQNGVNRLIPVGDSASITTQTGNLKAIFDSLPFQDIDENVSVQISVDNVQGTSTIEVSLYAIRVR